MVEVYDKVYIGTEASCRPGSSELVVVHACKAPCHQQAVGYRRSLPPQHPHYLVLRHQYDLFLNIIDPPVPLFKIETFVAFLQFAGEHYDRGASVLIHCNQGESRAPTLGLVLLAKHLRAIPSDSFSSALNAFGRLYDAYRPGSGIQQFLAVNWASLDLIG